MKSKDLQKFVLSKRQNGDMRREIPRDLNGEIGLRTIKRRYVSLAPSDYQLHQVVHVSLERRTIFKK